jgi:hypothetical protein
VVAPFSSGDKSLTGVIRLLAEGRCALATNFAAFKYDCSLLLLTTSICLPSWKFHSFDQSKLSGCHDFAAGIWYVTAVCTVFSILQISSTEDISGFAFLAIRNLKFVCHSLILSSLCSISEFMWLDFAINMGLGYCMTGIHQSYLFFGS